MAVIGNLGKLIIFEVSSKKVLTFGEMEQTVSGRWATHDRIRKKPKSEFLGPGQRTITLPITLSVMHGVKPRKTMKAIEKAIEKGTPYPFVLGGEKVGSYQWTITEMSEIWKTVIKDGKLAEASLDLTLSEYV